MPCRGLVCSIPESWLGHNCPDFLKKWWESLSYKAYDVLPPPVGMNLIQRNSNDEQLCPSGLHYKHFMIISFTIYSNSVKQVLFLVPFYRCGNWGIEDQVTCSMSHKELKPGFEPSYDFRVQTLCHHYHFRYWLYINWPKVSARQELCWSLYVQCLSLKILFNRWKTKAPRSHTW